MREYIVEWSETILLRRRATITAEDSEAAIDVVASGDRANKEETLEVTVADYHGFTAHLVD